MKIKRTAFSKARCNFPNCSHATNLSNITNDFRYRVAMDEKVFIPNNSMACTLHMDRSAWKDVFNLIAESCTFTGKYLEDMFTLLTYQPNTKGNLYVPNQVYNPAGCFERKLEAIYKYAPARALTISYIFLRFLRMSTLRERDNIINILLLQDAHPARCTSCKMLILQDASIANMKRTHRFL